MKKVIRMLLVFMFVSVLNGCAVDDGITPIGDPIDAYIGTWKVSDNELKVNYEVNIVRNPSNSSEVLINNFAGSGGAARALVTGKTLTLTSTVVGNNWLISGSGQLKTASRIDFYFNLTISGSLDKRFAIYTK